MKKVIVAIALIVVGYIVVTHALPTLPTGTAPMTPEEVGIKHVDNISIVSHDDTTATIAVKKPNQTATFQAPLINTYGNKIPQINLDGCALIDTRSQAFITMSLWASTIIQSALGNAHYGVLSPSGTLYTNLGIQESSATGTPGFISYTNYLGTAQLGGATDMPGSGKRADICNGACQK